MSDSHETTSTSPTATSPDGAPTALELDPAQRKEFEREVLYGEAVEMVRALIVELSLTQREVAHRIGVSDARMSRILSGRENLTLRTMADLGYALGVRFTLVAEPVDRRATPAEHDPDPPRWLTRHAALAARRVRDAVQGRQRGPSPDDEVG